ncbi:MAG: DUF1003 domain-containing protein [Chloroflexi bacterium]|jgi:hypothetical protein|nr:MAG: DUF1003 domain-containing protein [Chloroflexota bacterium]TMG07086.1 MAG: DUF1003 domain-containing protein [Chloroflexota bacterium]
MTQVAAVFEHIPHPHTRAMLAGSAPAPPKVDDERIGFNGKLGLFLTTIVGTMWAAYLFTVLAIVSFPSAIRSGDSIIIVAWIAQTFLQLVLLPIIIVGQNIQAKAADKRAEQTYKDAEAIMHECLQIQAHLAAQDGALTKEVAELRQLLGESR